MMVAEMEPFTYSQTPETWKPFHRDHPAYLPLADGVVRAILRARQNRLRTIVLSDRVLAITSKSKRNCRYHIVTLDKDGWPQACDLNCTGFQTKRICHHIGAGYWHQMVALFGRRHAQRMLDAAEAGMRQEQAEQDERDHGVVHSFTPRRGDYLRPE